MEAMLKGNLGRATLVGTLPRLEGPQNWQAKEDGPAPMGCRRHRAPVAQRGLDQAWHDH